MPSSKQNSNAISRLNGPEGWIFKIIGYSLILAATLLCLVPFILVLSGSFTKESAIFKYGFNLVPSEFSLDAYQMVFKNPTAILNAYLVTLFVTIIGTAVSLFLTAMTGYVLQKKELKSRHFLSLFFYFTTLFSGGLVPWYILMQRYLGMSNNLLALILPLMFNVFYIIIMRSFLKSIPDAISESAKIDGAGDFRTFISIILPLSKPALATVGMFTALNYWNDWQNAMLFMQKDQLYPLQYFLMKLLNNIEFAKQAASRGAMIPVINMPAESFKLAMTVVACFPSSRNISSVA